MVAEKGKIHQLNAGADAEPKGENLADKIIIQPGASKDMSKMALIVSLLSFVLLVVLFFGLNRNIEGLTTEVSALSGLRGEVEKIDARLLKLEDMPKQMKRMVMYNMSNDMAIDTAYLEAQVQDEAQKAKLQQIQQLIGEFKEDILKAE